MTFIENTKNKLEFKETFRNDNPSFFINFETNEKFPNEFFNSFRLNENSSIDDLMDFSIRDLNTNQKQEGNLTYENKLYFIKSPEIESNKKAVEEVPNFNFSLPINGIKRNDSINSNNIKEIIDAKNNFKNQNIVQKEIGIKTKNESKSTKFVTKLFKNEIFIKSKKHNCFSIDNLSKKIKSHFLNFCGDFSTDILNYLKENYENYYEIEKKFRKSNIVFNAFFKLNREYKTTDNKKKNYELKNKTLGDLINQEISIKFTNQNKKNNNKKIYEIIKKDELLKELFSIKYKTLFDIYYKNKHIVNIHQLNLDINIMDKYKLNKNIILSSKIKMFKDLLENNSTYKEFIKTNNYSLAKKYKASLINCIFKKYLLNAKFLLSE